MMCFVDLHKTHECSDVNKLVGEFQERMKSDAMRMSEIVVTCREQIRLIAGAKTIFSDQIARIEKQVCERAEIVMRLVDEEKEALLQELANIKKARVKEIDNVTVEIEYYMTSTDSLRKYTEEVKNKGTASDIARQTSALHDRADELFKCDVIQRAVKDLGSVQVTFTESVSSGNMIGGCSMKKSSELGMEAK